jgi:hypothetical protein
MSWTEIEIVTYLDETSDQDVIVFFSMDPSTTKSNIAFHGFTTHASYIRHRLAIWNVFSGPIPIGKEVARRCISGVRLVTSTRSKLTQKKLQAFQPASVPDPPLQRNPPRSRRDSYQDP